VKATRIPLLIAEAALLIGLLGWYFLRDGELLQAHWQVGADRASSEIYQEVDAETPIRLVLDLPFSAHVYLVSHDLSYGCSALFPSEYLRSDLTGNPLPAGEHILPGSGVADPELELFWQSGDATSPYTCLLIVSDKAIPELEAAVKRLRQMGNAAFPKKELLGGYAPTAGMEQVPNRNDLLHPAIKAAYGLIDVSNDGPLLPWDGHPGVYLKALRLVNRGRAPQPGVDLRQQINEKLSEQLEGLVELPKPGK
jgi:hypothetical protein